MNEFSLPKEIWIKILFTKTLCAEFPLNQTATTRKLSIDGMTGILTNVITKTFIPLMRSMDIVDNTRMQFNKQFPFHVFVAFPLFMKNFASCMFVSKRLHEITTNKLKLHCEKLQMTIKSCLQLEHVFDIEERPFYFAVINDLLITHVGVSDSNKIHRMCCDIYYQMTSEQPRYKRPAPSEIVKISRKAVKICIGKQKNGASCRAAAKFGDYCGRHKAK